MSKRVLAYHLVLTAYGFWLPNDPRGSWSSFVRSFDLYRAAGPATKVDTKRSVAGRTHDAELRRKAKQVLSRPPVRFSGFQARAVARGFADYCVKNHRRVYALAVMPDHAHLVIGRCELPTETLAEQLKARATASLNREGLHPFSGAGMADGRLPTPWARGSWSVFLDDMVSVRRAIGYVQGNPVKTGFKPQRYTWVLPFEEP